MLQNFTSPRSSEVEHLSIGFLAIWVSSYVSYLFTSFAHFLKIWLFVFFLLIYTISFYIADVSPVLDMCCQCFLPSSGFAISPSQSCLLMRSHVLSSHVLSLALSHFLCPFLWPSGCSCHVPSRISPLCLSGHSPLPPGCFPPTPCVWMVHLLLCLGLCSNGVFSESFL